MKVSYNLLKEYIDLNDVSPKKAAELLTMHSFEVEGIEKIGRDSILDVDILPNRAHDSLSHIGIAKELGALLGRKVKSVDIKVKENKKENIKKYISVKVEDKVLCPRYTARVILGAKVGPSPKWLRDILESLGHKSINNVVDVTNYTMLLMGQPTHVFDFAKIKNGKIFIKKAIDGEKIETLGGDEYSLDNYALIIAGEDGPFAIAGIKGGKRAEVDTDTKDLVLESAFFDPIFVRMASKKINLRTDSSMRFENEITPVLCSKALDFAASLIAELSGASVVSGTIDTNTKTFRKKIVYFTVSEIKEIIGLDVSEKDVLRILKSLGFIVSRLDGKDIFSAEVPYERLDVVLKEDIAEEIARVYGYENIRSKPILSELWPAKRNDQYFYSDMIRDIFSGFGLSDSYNYSFVGDEEMNIWGSIKEPIKLLNPLSNDKKYLRPSLLLHLLNNVHQNLKHQKSVRLFEIGEVFSVKDKVVSEKRMLSGVLAYNNKGGFEEFYELKGLLETFFSKLGVSDIYFSDIESEKRSFWHSERVSEVFLDDESIGFMGEIGSFVLDKFGIKTKVSAFELDLKKLIEKASSEFTYEKISKFPIVTRDLSILVESSVKVSQLQSVLEEKGGEFLVDIDLFDIYINEDSEEELNKSMAFHLYFQSKERTLSDKEVDVVMSEMIEAIEKEGWSIRK